MDAFIFSSRAS
jgi:bifunctional non-homologous end joining protein LigD